MKKSLKFSVSWVSWSVQQGQIDSFCLTTVELWSSSHAWKHWLQYLTTAPRWFVTLVSDYQSQSPEDLSLNILSYVTCELTCDCMKTVSLGVGGIFKLLLFCELGFVETRNILAWGCWKSDTNCKHPFTHGPDVKELITSDTLTFVFICLKRCAQIFVYIVFSTTSERKHLFVSSLVALMMTRNCKICML